MKRTRLFRAVACAVCLPLVALAAALGGVLAGCKAQRPATERVEPPGLPIVLSALTIRTESFNLEDIPEPYRAAEPREGRAYYLVHMTDAIRSSWLASLGQMNLKIEGYLSYNTLIIGMDPAVRDEVKKLDFVKWMGFYQPYFKIAPDIQALGVAGSRPQVDVTIFDPAAVTAVAQQVAGLGLPVVASTADSWRGKLRIVLDPLLLPKLVALPEVEWIEPATVAVTGAAPGAETAHVAFPFSLSQYYGDTYLQGQRVLDMSLMPWAPGTAQSYMGLAAETDRFAWEHRDWLALLPAGNQGGDANGDGLYDAGSIEPAGAAKDALVVGSSEARSGGQVTSFSGRGPAADGRVKPDLVAPMDPTTTLAALAGSAQQWLATQMGMASSSSALLRAILANAATAIGSGDADASPVPNGAQGWGNLARGDGLGLRSMLKVLDNQEGMGTGETRTYKVDVSDAGELRVTLAWTDYPSVPESGLNLVNDLDLRVIGPSNTYYYPNGRASRDPLNNLERVIVPLAGQPGQYTIEITASNVPIGPQPFALVAARF